MLNKHKKALNKAKFKKKITRTIGSILVDTILPKDEITPGEELVGEVELRSKKGLQEVERIKVSLMQQFMAMDNHISNLPLHSVEMRLTDEQRDAGEVTVPFSMTVPLYVPHNIGKRQCWIQTDVDIAYKLDPRDLDFIQVNPHPIVTKVNKVLTGRLGLLKTNREEVSYYSGFSGRFVIDKRVLNHPLYPMLSKRSVPLVHELEFFPPDEFKEKFKEIEIIYDIHPEGLDLYVELQYFIRKNIGGYFEREALRERGMDEVIHKIRFTNEELEMEEEIASKIFDLLQNAEEPVELRGD
ncbi:sporulation protein [Rossellomorea yichunensis]|jgi:sporulation-control protein|uniref:sporulation protein n=1 Tax=Rossellomorea yichunensis TaxID=3077331 RepID=UPI0028DFCB60|nr:sporulation protein [Rossellomorea sp. YC4-1]MDT9027843.1 sporulation protein [Rossellomorea sp. YC4-1]